MMTDLGNKKLQLHARIWVEIEGLSWLGPGRIRLLKALNTEGSISAAARKLEMSYHKAWKLVDSMNAASHVALVARSAGGRSGGGTKLTEYGWQALQVFEHSQSKIQLLLADLEQEMQEKLINQSSAKGK